MQVIMSGSLISLSKLCDIVSKLCDNLMLYQKQERIQGNPGLG